MALRAVSFFVFAFIATTGLSQKEKFVTYYGKDFPNSGYDSKVKYEEGKLVNDLKEGIWIKYHKDGITPKIKGEYVHNVPSGKYWKYHENGKLREIGTFINSQNVDSLKHFYEDGTLEYEAFYNANGREDGDVRFYFSNGQLEFVYHVVNGIPVGQSTRYFSNGEVKEVVIYDEHGLPAKKQQSHPMLENTDTKKED